VNYLLQNILYSSRAPVNFYERYVHHEDGRRRGNNDSWSSASTPRGSDRRGNDDSWSSAGTPQSTYRRLRRGNDDSWSNADTSQSNRRGSDRRGNDDYWGDACTPRTTQKSADAIRTSSQGVKSGVQHGYNDKRGQHENSDFSSKTSITINVAESRSESRKSTSTEEQKQHQKHIPKDNVPVIFSDSSNPFHLWYQAEVVIDNIRYHCIGQRLLHMVARGEYS